jgi:predicted dehydrogenase
VTTAAVVGTGSAGTRHARNLLDAGLDVVFVSRTADGPRSVGTKEVTVVDDLGAALAAADVAVVANPTSLHLDVLRRAIESGCHVLCEKPVATGASGVRAVAARAAAQGLVIAVDCQMRFHPLAVEMRELVRDGAIGVVVDVESTQGEHLADYHPDEDYRTSYAARADLGGGVLLTQIHQLDLLYWLLGPFDTAFAVGGPRSELELDVEDTVSYLLRSATGVPARGHVDYTQRPKRFEVTVTGTGGRVQWDYYAGMLRHHRADGSSERATDPSFERNSMFRALVDDFLTAIDEQGSPRTTLSDAAHELAVVDAVKRSMAEGRAIAVDDPEAANT